MYSVEVVYLSLPSLVGGKVLWGGSNFLETINSVFCKIATSRGFPLLCEVIKRNICTSYVKLNLSHVMCMCVHAKSLQLCSTPCDPMGYSPPGSSVHTVLQAEILPCLPPGDLPDPGVKPASLSVAALQVDSLPLSHQEGRRQWQPILAWKIPWTEEPGRLQSMGLRTVGHDWATSLSLFTFMHWRRKWQPTPVFLPGELQGWGSLVGCRL